MNISARLNAAERKLNPARDPEYKVYLLCPGEEGRDADGWAPGDREDADAAEARGDKVTIIVSRIFDENARPET